MPPTTPDALVRRRTQYAAHDLHDEVVLRASVAARPDMIAVSVVATDHHVVAARAGERIAAVAKCRRSDAGMKFVPQFRRYGSPNIDAGNYDAA